MKTKAFGLIRSLIISCFVASLPLTAFAGGNEGEKFNATEMIIHHVIDDHSWHIGAYKGEDGKEHHIAIPLPVIVFVDGQLDVFMSSALHHDTTVETVYLPNKKTGKTDTLQVETISRPVGRLYSYHNHLYEASGKSVFDVSITKNVASMMISVVLLIFVFHSAAAGYRRRQNQAPKGIQALIEPIVVYLRDEVIRPNLGARADAFLPYFVCLFFFIWFNNLLGLIPTGANLSGNISFTMTLAVFTFLITNLLGNKHYWLHILWTPGVPFLLRFIVLPVEILSIFTKPFALMIRLFANITAGHIIILSFISIIFIFKNALLGALVGPVVIAMTMFELFVAIFQAFIFTLLSSLFVGMAIEDHHEEAHH